MVMVLRVPVTFREIRRIHLYCPPNAHFEKGFQAWLDTLVILTRKLKIRIWISCESSGTLEAIRSWNARMKTGRLFEYRTYGREYDTGDLLVFVLARKNTLSYNRQYEHFVDKRIDSASRCDILVIYPQQ
jgi:hypothetical protein